jgi:hypothetical protein
MQFLCVVHVDRSLVAKMTPAEKEAFDRENREYGEWLADGHSVMFSALQEPETATLIRSREGKLSMTDGPYVETKEHMAGFIVVEARDQAEAIETVKNCPVARIGTMEVRASNYVSPSARDR